MISQQLYRSCHRHTLCLITNGCQPAALSSRSFKCECLYPNNAGCASRSLVCLNWWQTPCDRGNGGGLFTHWQERGGRNLQCWPLWLRADVLITGSFTSLASILSSWGQEEACSDLGETLRKWFSKGKEASMNFHVREDSEINTLAQMNGAIHFGGVWVGRDQDLKDCQSL